MANTDHPAGPAAASSSGPATAPPNATALELRLMEAIERINQKLELRLFEHHGRLLVLEQMLDLEMRSLGLLGSSPDAPAGES